MKDPKTLEGAVAQLAAAVETCLAADTVEEARAPLERVGAAVDEILGDIEKTPDARTVEGRPLREAFEDMRYTVDACIGADGIGPVKQTLGEMLRALQQVDRELAA